MAEAKEIKYWHPILKKLLAWCYKTNAGERGQQTLTIIIKSQYNIRNNRNAYNEGEGKKRLADPIEKFFPEELASEQHRAVRRGQTDITGRVSFQEAGTG